MPPTGARANWTTNTTGAGNRPRKDTNMSRPTKYDEPLTEDIRLLITRTMRDAIEQRAREERRDKTDWLREVIRAALEPTPPAVAASD